MQTMSPTRATTGGANNIFRPAATTQTNVQQPIPPPTANYTSEVHSAASPYSGQTTTGERGSPNTAEVNQPRTNVQRSTEPAYTGQTGQPSNTSTAQERLQQQREQERAERQTQTTPSAQRETAPTETFHPQQSAPAQTFHPQQSAPAASAGRSRPAPAGRAGGPHRVAEVTRAATTGMNNGTNGGPGGR